jgi:SAM-dependent methyltransferase
MLKLTHASLATIDQLFHYKSLDFKLETFPGYTPDQWGIKAHNRPWIEEVGKFEQGMRILEVGGAYSLLPKYLGEKYKLEAWIGDDFGGFENNSTWSRWGSPHELPLRYPSVKYIFEPLGSFHSKYPDQFFDCIYSVSTLEHIPQELRLNVFKDMNRCLKPGGRQIHTIDIGTNWKKSIISSIIDSVPIIRKVPWKGQSEIRDWVNLIKKSGVKITTPTPNPIKLLDRRILVESPDIVYRFYPPNNEPKPYNPGASLLLIIDDI